MHGINNFKIYGRVWLCIVITLACQLRRVLEEIRGNITFG